MRHLLMGHGMHGGMMGFMAMHLLRRMMMKLVLIGVVAVGVLLWLRSRQNGGGWR
jgi:hypothetical protein